MKTWCDSWSECVYACVCLPRPWKYLPHTRHAYTLKLCPVTQHAFSKSKSSTIRLIVSRNGQRKPGSSHGRIDRFRDDDDDDDAAAAGAAGADGAADAEDDDDAAADFSSILVCGWHGGEHRQRCGIQGVNRVLLD